MENVSLESLKELDSSKLTLKWYCLDQQYYHEDSTPEECVKICEELIWIEAILTERGVFKDNEPTLDLPF